MYEVTKDFAQLKVGDKLEKEVVPDEFVDKLMSDGYIKEVYPVQVTSKSRRAKK